MNHVVVVRKFSAALVVLQRAALVESKQTDDSGLLWTQPNCYVKSIINDPNLPWFSVLKRLEIKSDCKVSSPDYIIEEMKGKSRVVNLKANIEIPTKAEHVEKYLREMCQKLSACPNLVSEA